MQGDFDSDDDGGGNPIMAAARLAYVVNGLSGLARNLVATRTPDQSSGLAVAGQAPPVGPSPRVKKLARQLWIVAGVLSAFVLGVPLLLGCGFVGLLMLAPLADTREQPQRQPLPVRAESSKRTTHEVKGYYRKEGTYVRSHARSNPNDSTRDNLKAKEKRGSKS